MSAFRWTDGVSLSRTGLFTGGFRPQGTAVRLGRAWRPPAEPARPDEVPDEEMLAHLVRMRAVNRAAGYDVTRESGRIAGLRARIRAGKGLAGDPEGPGSGNPVRIAEGQTESNRK